ncbi:hypothetical protein JCM8097_001256 [Rhodosporidiobolus ruineniae]
MDNPWGAPDTDDSAFSASLPRPASPKLDLALPSTSATFGDSSTPSWGADDGDGGWGGAVDDYVPGVFASAAAGPAGAEESKADGRDEVGFSSSSAVKGWGADSPELSKATPSSPGGFAPSPPLPPPVPLAQPPSPLPLSPPSFAPAPSFDEPAPPSVEEDDPGAGEDDGRGWGPDEDDLPPISSLRLAAPSDAPTLNLDRADDWVDPDEAASAAQAEEDAPLPSFGDAFSKTPRRNSAENERDGEAWGSAVSYEEQQRLEAEIREKVRRAEMEYAEEEEALRRQKEGLPPLEKDKPTEKPSADSTADGAPPPSATRSRFSFLPKLRAGAEQAAVKSVETVNAVASKMEQHAAPEPPKTGMSSLQGDPPAEPEKTESPDPQQQGAVGRFLGRFRRPASAPMEGKDGQQQQQQPQEPARKSAEHVDFNPDDLDVLAGGVSRPPPPSAPARTIEPYDEDEDEQEASGIGRFFGRSKPAVVAQAPPEDDFGGLLGAFSTAPVKPSVTSQAVKPRGALDPFDPLSETFGAVAVPNIKPVSLGRPPPTAPRTAAHPPPAAAGIASFPSLAAPSQTQAARASSPMDDFDAFFDSVAVSTGNKPAPSSAAAIAPPAVLSPTPRAQPAQNNILRPSSSAARLSSTSSSSARPSVISPPPRIATISPPTRTSTASPSSSTGRSTPILPLAPPPPPSQPLAASRQGLISIDGPPPTSRSAPPVPQAGAASGGGGGGALKPAPSAAQKQPLSRSSSGPLSLDDLSFFES